MNDWKMKAFWGAALAIPLIATAWLYSKYEIRGRIGELAQRASALGHTRGGFFPTEDEIRAKVEADAAELDLELDDLRISFVVNGGPPRVGAPQVEQFKQQIRELPQREWEDGAPVPRAPRNPQLPPETRIDIEATCRGRRFFWTVEQDFKSSPVLRGEPNAPRLGP
jgi:hypothetical protein